MAISSLAMRYQRGLSLVGFEEILHCVAAKEEIKEFKEIKEVKEIKDDALTSLNSLNSLNSLTAPYSA